MFDTVIDFVDVTCPSCSAGEGEPCTKWCDDDSVGLSRNTHRRAQWDDGESW